MEEARSIPGRNCPLDYRYEPRDLNRPADFAAEALYVVGGLYGNPQALEAVLGLAAREPAARVVFNGDFHWFDVRSDTFQAINEAVLAFDALRGNVETELARREEGAGCGCAYPEWVPDAVVERSNAIMVRLRETARGFPALVERLAVLPRFLVVEVAGERVAIVHGDAHALAGWNFSAESLDGLASSEAPARWFTEANVRVFACSHTCLPVLREVALPAGLGCVVNNGAAGMPNFAGTRFGVVTRIGATPAPEKILYGVRLGGLRVEALPLPYDHARWQRAFLADWPPGSPAFESYFDRMLRGPAYSVARARPRRLSSAAALG
ncbi:MAG: hypothetical protein AB1830_15240 [Pseudomonadota bacterium]